MRQLSKSLSINLVKRRFSKRYRQRVSLVILCKCLFIHVKSSFLNDMRKYVIWFLVVIVLGIFVIIFYNNKIKSNTSQSRSENSPISIRIGWQIPWATQGQLTQILKHTDILEKNGLKAEFKGFNYGPPLNEAALAGEVDVIFTADQPAATLLTKNPNWVIIGRLMYNRVSLYVPPKSAITSVADLRGKTVAMPFGAAAQPHGT